MIRRFVLALALLLTVTASALAANPAGKWKGAIDTPDGPITVLYAFAVEGDKLSGTATGPQGDLTIENGSVNGDIITFTLTLGDGTLILHEATVVDDSMSMTARGPWGEVTFEVQRVTE